MQRLTKRNIKVINHDTGQQIDFPTFGKEAGEDAYNQVSNQLTSLQSQLESSIASMSEAIVTDKTLTIEDAPADAKAAGDAINNLRGAVGSPLVAATAASMTDTNKVYVYTGSETGYTNGNWYYHDGTNWVSGGVYNSVAVDLDSTLTLANKAPDSKVVGDAISSLNEDITNIQTATASDVGKALKAKTVTNGKVTEWEFGEAGGADPAEIEQAVEDYLDEHPVVASAAGVVSVADYGAVGDGVTDDSAAIQTAVNNNYNVYFESNRTYYMASPVTINHDIKLHGGENTIIKTQSVTSDGTTTLNMAFVCTGTLKKTTTLTTDYSSDGSTDNSSNMFTLSDMTGINVGDLMEIVATDQYYSYGRQYYYLGATLLIGDIYNGHLFTTTNIPFDIENTAYTSVKIYDAPEIHIEHLKFVSDLAPVGFKFFIELEYCKNSVIRDCSMTMMWNGLRIYHCFNSLIDTVMFSMSKYAADAGTDSYGITVESSTNTTIQNIHAVTSQGCLDLSGTYPSINTYVRNCTSSAECRAVGIDMHENTYNFVIEDCDIGGLSLFGTAIAKRCRIYRNNRVGGEFGIVVRGSHDERFARFTISDCEFFGSHNDSYISIGRQYPQTPIRAYDNIVGELVIKNCRKGFLRADPGASQASILSNVVKKLSIDNWQECYEIYHKGFEFECVQIKNSSFINNIWINNHVGYYNLDDIHFLHIMDDKHGINRLIVNRETNGEIYAMPYGIPINVSSDDTSTHFVICGKNLMPNNPDDLVIGSVLGSVGSSISRSKKTGFDDALSMDGNHLVFTQPNNTTKADIYPKCFAYVREASTIKLDVTLKNIGETEGTTFRAYFATINCATGKITYRDTKNSAQATAEGTHLSAQRFVSGNSLVLFYVYTGVPIANSVTKLENFMASATPISMASPSYEKYIANRRDGDGTINSIQGLNNVLSSAQIFSANFGVDYSIDPVGAEPSAMGVSF